MRCCHGLFAILVITNGAPRGYVLDLAFLQLLDKSSICEIQVRYCRAVDRMDFDLMRSCFHADAIYDHPLRTPCGIEEWIDWCQGLSDYESTSTLSSNQIVEIHGNVAWAEQYLLAFHRSPPKGEHLAVDWTVNCRYIDRLERRNDTWRIAHRIYVLDSERSDPVDEYLAVPVGLRRSRRSSEDPSYIRD